MAVEISSLLRVSGTVTRAGGAIIQLGLGLMSVGSVRIGVGDYEIAIDPEYWDVTGSVLPSWNVSLLNSPAITWTEVGVGGTAPNSRRFNFFDDAGAAADIVNMRLMGWDVPFTGVVA